MITPTPPRPPGRNAPLTSIAHLGRNTNKPLTSIAHADNSGRRAVTSIAHVMNPGGAALPHRHEYSAEEEEAITNNLREKFIIKRMKEKAEAAKAAAVQEKASKPTKYSLDVNTGKSMKMGGTGGLKRQIAKHFHEHKAAFKNISKEDREMFTSVVGSYAKKKVTNASFTKVDRKKLRKTITEKYKGGEISRKDRSDFHKIINQLD